MQNIAKPILVTGATGYIAAHTIQLLLEAGKKVRGTVRSLANNAKYKFLQQFKGSENLQLVQGDLSNQECWDKIVSGCDEVLHIASPIPPYIPKNQDQVILPAVNGTKFVLNASIKNKVKRVVFTSSCLTILFGNEDKQILNQTMWSDVNKTAHYPKSKILAQKALWEIYNAQNLNAQHTEVVSLLVAMVTGPGLSVHSNSSEALIAQVLRGTYPGIPEPAFNPMTVDVRDVAISNLRALQAKNISGQRIAIAGRNINMSEIFQIVNQNFPKANLKMQKVTPEGIKASGNGVAMRALGMLGKRFKVDNSKSVKLLNMKYTQLKDSIIDMCNQLIKLGVVKYDN